MPSLSQEVLDVVDEVQIFVTSECHQKSVTNFDLVLKILYTKWCRFDENLDQSYCSIELKSQSEFDIYRTSFGGDSYIWLMAMTT